MPSIVSITSQAAKTIKTLDNHTRDKILRFLREVLSVMANPRSSGKPLVCALHVFWRYRLGDYRLICDIRDAERVIMILKIGHRHDIYK